MDKLTSDQEVMNARLLLRRGCLIRTGLLLTHIVLLAITGTVALRFYGVIPDDSRGFIGALVFTLGLMGLPSHGIIYGLWWNETPTLREKRKHNRLTPAEKPITPPSVFEVGDQVMLLEEKPEDGISTGIICHKYYFGSRWRYGVALIDTTHYRDGLGYYHGAGEERLCLAFPENAHRLWEFPATDPQSKASSG